MAILVDQVLDRGRKWTRAGHSHSCHMACDVTDQRGLLELCEFASALGLADQWLQWGGPGRRVPHFDLTIGKRALALQAGARLVDMRVLLRTCIWPAEGA